MRLNMAAEDLVKAINEVIEETGKDSTEVLNHTARDVAYRAIQFTPKAKTAAIAKWTNPRAVYKLINYLRKKKGMDAINGDRMKAEAAIFIRRKYGSIGYIKVGWFNAVVAFGGTIRAKRPVVSKAGNASKGKGIKATPSQLIAQIINTANGADSVGYGPLVEAMAFKADDMRNYLARKIGGTMRRHSAR